MTLKYDLVSMIWNLRMSHLPMLTEVENIITHPQYNDFEVISKGFDVALLKLSRPVQYSLHILPICLPKDDKLLLDIIAWTKGMKWQFFHQLSCFHRRTEL